jgi:hypothetical protein
MPEQFLLHVKQAVHSVKWAGLVDEFYSACKKHIAAQKNWEKALASIVKYEKDNVKKGPFRHLKGRLKRVKGGVRLLLKSPDQGRSTAYCSSRWHLHPICQPAFC